EIGVRDVDGSERRVHGDPRLVEEIGAADRDLPIVVDEEAGAREVAARQRDSGAESPTFVETEDVEVAALPVDRVHRIAAEAAAARQRRRIAAVDPGIATVARRGVALHRPAGAETPAVVPPG